MSPADQETDLFDDEKILKNDDGTVTIILSQSIKSILDGNKEIKEITIPKLVAKHFFGFNITKPTFKDLLEIASNASGYTMKDLGNLAPGDAFKITGVVGSFL